MGDEAPILATSAVPASPGEPSRGAVGWSIGLVLWFGWLPWIGATVLERMAPEPARSSAAEAAFGMLTAGLGQCFLVTWIVARDRAWAVHGIRRPRPGLDLLLALAVCAVTNAVTTVFTSVMHRFGICAELDALCEPGASASGGFPVIFAGFGFQTVLQRAFEIGYLCVMAAAEEFVFRGFLLPRLAQVCRSKVMATVVSSVLFASYHAYQGGWAVLFTFVYGSMMAFGFWWTGRIWPLVLAHALTNLWH